MGDLSGVPPVFRGDIGLDDLRRRVLLFCAVACLVVPFGLLVAFSRPAATDAWVPLTAIALFAIAGMTYLAGHWRVSAGAATVVVGLVALATYLIWVEPLRWTVHLLPLVVLFASGFSGPIGGLATAAAVSGDLLLVSSLGGPLPSESLRIVLVLTWANVPVAWLASEPIRLALEWSWGQYVRAEQEADRARRQQAELGQLVKSLNVAQDRLERDRTTSSSALGGPPTRPVE